MFADFFAELLGWGCFMFFCVLFAIGYAAQKIGEAAGKALKSDTAKEITKEAARIGFLAWWLSDDD